MSDCAYVSNSSLSWWDSFKMSGCAYGSSGPIFQVMSIAKAFLFLVSVGLTNQSRLILVGAAVSFVRVLALATVVVVFITLATVLNMTTTVARANTLTKLTAAPTRIILYLFASLTLTRNRKALDIDMT